MKMQENSDDEILEMALRSLSNVFKKPLNELQKLLTASLVANWRNCKLPHFSGHSKLEF